MPWVMWRWSALCVVVGLCVAGCGGGATPTSEEPVDPVADVADTGGLKSVAAATLPPLGNPLPPNLDGGRVSDLAPPKDWFPLPRDSAHVARFVMNKSNPNDLPRILVTATDADIFTQDVTADNVTEFAEVLHADLDESKLLETPKPLLIGDNAYARYVGKASKGARLVARQVLETVYDGRRYTITLETFDARLLEHRDLAYAVAAAIRFGAPPSTPVPAAPEAPDESE
jgi:hypothetical protein